MANDSCPIWGTSATILPTTRDGQNVDSPRAGGRYFISGTAQATLKHRDDSVRARLTKWLVEQRLLGVRCPEIMSNTIDEAEQRQPLPVHQRADGLLRYLVTKSGTVGTKIPFVYGSEDDDSDMLAWSESTSADELFFLVDYLAKQSWIDVSCKNAAGGGLLTVTVHGHAHLAEFDKASVNSCQAFVAMWFDDSMKAAYEEGIAPAIRQAGYEPLRIDRKEHINRIDDEIIAEIRRSRFLVADFTQGETGARGGVYYEAGFAHGLNVPVIFTCRQDAIGKVHFDTRQYNHITWITPDELHTRLAQRIAATIGDGPLKKFR